MEGTEFLEKNPAEYDPSRTFVESVPRMVRMARRSARCEAISYRNVKVGAAIMFYYSDSEGHHEAILSGSNLKAKQSDEKYCAEMDVIDQAESLALRGATGLVIAGPSHPGVVQSISETVTPTLHPCESCRQKMGESREIIPDEALIVTVSTEENLFQVHSAAELMMLYNATDTREAMFLEAATPLEYDIWSKRVELYDDLNTGNPGTSRQVLAKIALENMLESPDN